MRADHAEFLGAGRPFVAVSARGAVAALSVIAEHIRTGDDMRPFPDTWNADEFRVFRLVGVAES